MKWNETIKPRLSIHRRNSTHSCGFSQCYLNAAKRQQQTFVCVWKFHFMSEPSVWFEKNAHKAQGAAWSLTAKWQFAVKFVFQWERWTFVALTCGRFCPFQTKCWDNRLLFSSVREHGWNLQNRIVWGKQNSIGCKKKRKKKNKSFTLFPSSYTYRACDACEKSQLKVNLKRIYLVIRVAWFVFCCLSPGS